MFLILLFIQSIHLMKMFNLLGIGERARGGIPDIYQVWADQGWNSPVVEEFYNPDRGLGYHLISAPKQRKKQTKKTSEEKRKKLYSNQEIFAATWVIQNC